MGIRRFQTGAVLNPEHPSRERGRRTDPWLHANKNSKQQTSGNWAAGRGFRDGPEGQQPSLRSGELRLRGGGREQAGGQGKCDASSITMKGAGSGRTTESVRSKRGPTQGDSRDFGGGSEEDLPQNSGVRELAIARNATATVCLGRGPPPAAAFGGTRRRMIGLAGCRNGFNINQPHGNVDFSDD